MNNLVELYLAVSMDGDNYIVEFLEELHEKAPEVLDFLSLKIIEDLKKQLDTLGKIVSKADNTGGFKLNGFLDVDQKLMDIVYPYFKNWNTSNNIKDTFNLSEFTENTKCLQRIKERQSENKTQTEFPDFFMRLSPINLVKCFDNEYDDSCDTRSVTSSLTIETELTQEEQQLKSNSIIAVFDKLKEYLLSIAEDSNYSVEFKLALTLLSAACLEYGEFHLDFDKFIKIVKFNDDEVDIEKLEEEIMVQRNYEGLGVFCNLKTVSEDLKRSFVESLAKNKEYGILMRTD